MDSTKLDKKVHVASTLSPEVEDSKGIGSLPSSSVERGLLDRQGESQQNTSNSETFSPLGKWWQEGPYNWSTPLRGKISGFSSSSRTRFQFTLRNTRFRFSRKISLTYPEEAILSGPSIKKHFKRFLTHLRLDYPGVLDLWWLEFEENGTPRFNLLVSCESIGEDYVKPLWAHIVKSNNPFHLSTGANVQVMSKGIDQGDYFTECSVKRLPVPTTLRDGIGRFWGCSRKLLHPTLSISMSKGMLQCLIRQIEQFPLKSGNHVYVLEDQGIIVCGARLSVQIFKHFLHCVSSCSDAEIRALLESERSSGSGMIYETKCPNEDTCARENLASCLCSRTSSLYRVLLANYDANLKLEELSCDLVHNLVEHGYEETGLLVEKALPHSKGYEPHLLRTRCLRFFSKRELGSYVRGIA